MDQIIKEWYASLGRKGGAKRRTNPKRFEYAKAGALARWKGHVKRKEKQNAVKNTDIPS